MPSKQSIHFVRGGQTSIHWIRMAKQVFGGARFAILLVVAAYIAFRAWYWTERYDWYIFYEYFRADGLIGAFAPDTEKFVFHLRDGTQSETTIGVFTSDPAVLQVKKMMVDYMIAWSIQSLVLSVVVFVLVTIFFIYVGAGLSVSKRVRGAVLVSPDDLKAIIEDKWKIWRKERKKTKEDEYRYSLAGIHYPPDAPMGHTLITGTVGAGKTVAMTALLDEIRKNGGKAVIYDRMGNFTREYFDPEQDAILNPFDQRDKGWSPFADADDIASFAAMTEAMIPPPQHTSDEFWMNAARIVFRSAAMEIANEPEPSIKKLVDLLLHAPISDLVERLQGSSGASVLDPDSPKTAASIRTNVVVPLEFLEHLSDKPNPFSVKKWVKQEDRGGFLFLSGKAEHAAATRNLISVAIELAANATMACSRTSKPRIWFFADELPALNVLPCLAGSMAEIRQFGGCFVIGFQVFSQMEKLYGDKVASAISGIVNNRLILSTPDYETAELGSKSLGYEDIREKTEGMSIGANETRDGVTFNERRVERFIATPSEIMDLPQLSGYLRFAYDTPRSLIKLEHVKRNEIAAAFIPRTKKPTPDERVQLAKAHVIPDQPDVIDGEIIHPDTGEVIYDSREYDPARPHPGEENWLGEFVDWLEEFRGIETPFHKPLITRVVEGHDIIIHREAFIKQRRAGLAPKDIEGLQSDPVPPTTQKAAHAAWLNNSHRERLFITSFFIRQDRDEHDEAPYPGVMTDEARKAARVELDREYAAYGFTKPADNLDEDLEAAEGDEPVSASALQINAIQKPDQSEEEQPLKPAADQQQDLFANGEAASKEDDPGKTTPDESTPAADMDIEQPPEPGASDAEAPAAKAAAKPKKKPAPKPKRKKAVATENSDEKKSETDVGMFF